MKKVLILAIIFIIAGSLFVFAKTDDNENGVVGILNKILEKLNIIAEKNTTIEVNVESPNLTILPPEVTVNPNITLPEKECKWEKLNQEKDNLNIGTEGVGCCGFHKFTRTIHIPSNIVYSNVSVKGGRIQADCTHADNKCRFLINDVDCGSILSSPSGFSGVYEFSQICIDALIDGANNLTISVPSNGNGHLNQYYLEMEVIPVNC